MQPLEKAHSEQRGAGEPPDPSGGCEHCAGLNEPHAFLTCSVSTHLPAHLAVYHTPLSTAEVCAQSIRNARLSFSLLGETSASLLSTQPGCSFAG